MFVYKSRFLTRGEVWFDDEPDQTPVDWIYHRQRSRPIARARSKPFYTLLINLTKSSPELLADMESRTVQKIQYAQERDRTYWESCDPADPKILDEIERRWNEFARARETARFDRPWFQALIAARSLVISAGKDPQGRVLAYHLTYVSELRAQQLIIVSEYRPSPNAAFRGLVNRANCLGHWFSFLTLKARGLRYFDFGGWYPGNTDIELLGMNAFKRSFGGQIVREYECERILTLKAWVIITAARIWKRARTFRAFTKSTAKGAVSPGSAPANHGARLAPAGLRRLSVPCLVRVHRQAVGASVQADVGSGA